MTITRDQVDAADKWNVEALFPSLEVWKSQLDALKANGKLDTSRILKFKGRLGESPETVKMALEEIFSMERKLTQLHTWSHLKHDEDIGNSEYKSAHKEARNALFDYQRDLSWFEPELLSLAEETHKTYLNSPALKDLKFYLEQIFRMKKHTLSVEEEWIASIAGKAFQTPSKAFSALNDADMKFAPVKDSQGNDHEVTHARYSLLTRSQDRVLRENTYKSYMRTFGDFQNTYTELLDGVTQNHLFRMRSKKYSSCLESALYPNNIDVSVYHSLIGAVREKIGALHYYYKVRQKALKLDQIHLYDMSVPLTPELDIRMPYCEAEDIILESVRPLGSEYQTVLKRGFKEDKWVDRYENKNKRSGAYSSGCFDSQPYILMNYKEILRDVFTLAHEAGHSMHSYYSRKNQPYYYSDYPIFLAEVASTFNEEMLMRHLIKNVKTKEEKIFLINQKLEDIRGTLFRQTMFAEFELLIHTFAEQEIPLTPQLLNDEYLKLARFYFGPDVTIDDEVKTEWARIPHFYYNFYVYQYATGISAALALSKRVADGDRKEREEYLSFLKSGSSRYPIETLKLAGVDMSTTDPVKSAINVFENLTKELEQLI